MLMQSAFEASSQLKQAKMTKLISIINYTFSVSFFCDVELATLLLLLLHMSVGICAIK